MDMGVETELGSFRVLRRRCGCAMMAAMMLPGGRAGGA